MKNQNKESLQTTIIKTFLAVLLFAGIGTIIIGGGYIIGEYSKTQNSNNKIIKELPDEWGVCNQNSDCVGIRLGCACYIENAINKVYLNAWTDILQEKCGDNCMIDLRLRLPSDNIIDKAVCENNRCELRQKKEIACTQNAALDFLDDKQSDDPCDRSCEFDSDCKLECGCECISKDEKCIYTGLECERPNPDYDCQCVNQNCKYNYIGTDTDTSNWQTYRNEEFGFEFQYPAEFGEVAFEITPEISLPVEGEKVGMKMEGTFSESGMVFGGKTTTYNDVSRQITKINFKEYIKNDEGYFFGFNRYQNELYGEMTPKKIINNNVLLVDCESFTKRCLIVDTYMSRTINEDLENSIAGLINLRKGEFKGLMILANNRYNNKHYEYISEDEFIKILSSFKFID